MPMHDSELDRHSIQADHLNELNRAGIKGCKESGGWTSTCLFSRAAATWLQPIISIGTKAQLPNLHFFKQNLGIQEFLCEMF